MCLFSCFSRLNCYNQHCRYYHLANKLVLARAAFTSYLGHLLFLGTILQPFFLTEADCTNIHSLTDTQCNRKDLRSIPFIDSATCCLLSGVFFNLDARSNMVLVISEIFL